MSKPTFLDRVYNLAALGHIDDAIDLIFDHIDRRLIAGEFEAVDGILGQVDLKRLPTTLMHSFLTITAAAQDKLEEWDDFYRAVYREYEATRGAAMAKRLLDGYKK